MTHLSSLASMTLEILNGAFVFLVRHARFERAEIATPAGVRVDLARIEPVARIAPVAAGLELADHRPNRRRLEDRYPSYADPRGARPEPDRAHGGHRRILDHLRHSVTPQPMPLRGRTIGEDRELAGRIVQSG